MATRKTGKGPVPGRPGPTEREIQVLGDKTQFRVGETTMMSLFFAIAECAK